MKRLILATLTAVIMIALVCVSAGIPAPRDRDVSGDAPRITMEELNSMLGDPNLVIIDSLVGDQWETVAQKLPGAVHENPDDVDSWADKYPKDKTIVTYCA
jgi:predicted sulfurtransferase